MQHKTSGSEVLEKFIETAPQQAAETLQSMPLAEAVFWVSTLKSETIVLCFKHMNTQKAAHLLRRLPVKQGVHITKALPAVKAALIMQNLPVHYKTKLLASMEPKAADILQRVLNYVQGAAAQLMQSNFLSFKTDVKIKDINLKIKTLPKNKIPFCVYVLDKAGRCSGIIRTAELPMFQENSLAGSVMTPAFEKLSPEDKPEAILNIFKTSGAPIAAVVDVDGFIMGVINAVDMLGRLEADNAAAKTQAAKNKKLFIGTASVAAVIIIILIWSFAL